MVTVDPEAEEYSSSLQFSSGQEFNYVLEGTLKLLLMVMKLF